VASFAAQVAAIALGRRPPELVVGDLDVTRDYLDVRDVVSAYALLLGRGLNGEVYNVGSGQERSLRSLLETLLRLSGVQARLVVDPQRLRPTEQRRMCASPAKLRAATGWRPRRSLEDSLRDLLRDAMERDDA
jgi:GDP-4-dehydro-6-deoxy-D-mannose reductase